VGGSATPAARIARLASGRGAERTVQREVQEVALEALLRQKFPRDVFEPVPKGEFGGDLIQRVVGPAVPQDSAHPMAGTFWAMQSFKPDVNITEVTMGFGRGALLWLLGVPIPIILLLALFWHH
jgi:hypothetical protein